MRLSGVRYAESPGKARGRRNVTLGVVKHLPGYFEIPTDEGWRITLDLAGKRLKLKDAWGMTSTSPVTGDLAPFVWAYRYCGFCVLTIFDKDLGEIRDDLLFVAKRRGVELLWRQTAA